MEQFFATEKPKLRKLTSNITFFGDGKKKNILQLASKVTDSLTDVWIATSRISSLGDCNEFLHSNKNLHRFHINVITTPTRSIDSATEMESLTSLLHGLRNSPEITEFQVESKILGSREVSKVADVCTALTLKRLSVAVNEREF